MLNNIYLESVVLFNANIFIQYIILCSIQIHPFNAYIFVQYRYIMYSIPIYLFNTNIIIQYITFCSKQISSFDADVFIQYKFLYSIILAVARPNHMTYWVFWREAQAVMASIVRVIEASVVLSQGSFQFT